MRSICTYPAGEFRITAPSIDLVLEYDGGEGFVSDDASVGYASINIQDFRLEENAIPAGEYADAAQRLRNASASKLIRFGVKKILRRNPVVFAYSRGVDGIEHLLAPADENDSQFTIPGKYELYGYSALLGAPKMEKIIALHEQAIAGLPLEKNAELIESRVRELIPYASNVVRETLAYALAVKKERILAAAENLD